MAKRFKQWMEHHAEGHGLEFDLRIAKAGRFVSAEELSENPDLETASPYEISDEHLKEWIDFFRHCEALKSGRR